MELFLLLKSFFLLQIDESVQKEIINHRYLRHPNIVQFKEVFRFLFVALFLFFMSMIGVLGLIDFYLPKICTLGHSNPNSSGLVILTPTHLAIVMEYASGGESFDGICNAGRFNEDEVLNFSSIVGLYSMCGG